MGAPKSGITAPHQPTEKTRAEVAALKSFGTTHEQIALYLDIGDDALVKYYKKELDTALTKANAMVAKGLFNKATQQDDLQAQIFWLKTRGRWRTADKESIEDNNQETLSKIKILVDDLNKTNSSDI